MAHKNQANPAEPTGEDAAPEAEARRKSRPTPSRRDAEAARRQRLNPTLSPKEARRRQRALEQVKQRQAMQAMDESPARLLVRDVVDSRWNLGEILLPVLILGLAVGLIPVVQQYNAILLAFVWGYMAAVIIDAWLMWRRVKRLAAERIPHESLKGALMFGVNRQVTTRRRRRPAPRVKVGEDI
ncbi:MAG: DUF3043 domain-containing protein [Propioniciclava sp.]